MMSGMVLCRLVFLFCFILNLIVVTEEVAGCLLCALIRADTFAVSSIELKQG